MSLALNGQVYEKKYIPFNIAFHAGIGTESGFEYGIGFTPDHYRNKTIPTGIPDTIQEITIPNYYYTNTDWLRNIGYKNIVDSIIGVGETAQVLIIPHIVPYAVDTSRVEQYSSGLYLLAQYQSNKNPSDNFCNTVYNALAMLGTILPLPPDSVTQLNFFNSKGELVPLDPTKVDLWDTVESCKFVNADKSLSPIQFFCPLDSSNDYSKGYSYIDLYIAGYHMRINYSTNNVYIKTFPNIAVDQYFTDPSCRFWTALNALPMKLVDAKSSSTSVLSNYGYNFKTTSDNHVIGWDAKTGDNIVGRNDTNITFYKPDDIGLSTSRRIVMNASPNVYNAIGKQTDNTIGVLPAGAMLNNIGMGDISIATFPSDYGGGGDIHRFYPLGKYHLNKDYIYFYYSGSSATSYNTTTGTQYNYINTYTLDGVVLFQVVYYGYNYTSGHSGRRIWRMGYYIYTKMSDGSTTYIPYWSEWNDGEYY